MSITIIWTYVVADAARAAFEAAYGPNGDWAQLFRKGEGYLGTELLRKADGGYATLDRWRSEADFDAFKQRFGAEYAALDAVCEKLTSAEQKIGVFGSVD